MQGELFEPPLFDILSSLINNTGNSHIIVIGCGRRKKKSNSQAKFLYVSKRFKTSKDIAENLSAYYLILSAFHGIITPDKELDPYDFDIGKLPEESKNIWANAALDNIYKISGREPVTILADGDYAELLLKFNANRIEPLNVTAPLVTIAMGHRQDWLNQALQMSFRIRDLRRLYTIINQARNSGNTLFLVI